MVKEINGCRVEGNLWEKGSQRRMYFKIFSGGKKPPGQACWDIVNSQWIKSHCEPGAAFKSLILKEFGL